MTQSAENDAPPFTLPGDWHRHPDGYVHDDSLSACLALRCQAVEVNTADVLATLAALGWRIIPPEASDQ